MSKSNNRKYDVAVIGAGISGLICACYLAKAGMKVLLIEQHDKPGGYFTSFKRGKLLFDAAAHSFGNYRQGGHVNKILTELGVNKIINIKRFDPSDIVITPDFDITFWNDLESTIGGLVQTFPHEQQGIISFFNFLTASKQSEFSKLRNKNFLSLLQSFINDDRLINALAFPVLGNGGLPPSLMHAFSGSKIFSEFLIDGGYYPEGGIQHLPNALAHIITQNRGEILYRRKVERIICDRDSVAGVVLDKNESCASKYVVSACDMTQTFRTFLGEEAVGAQTMSALNKMQPSVSTLILYIGIDDAFNGLPHPGTNVWYLPYYDLDNIYNQGQLCNFAATGFMLRVSPDKKTIVAFTGAPFRTADFWRQNKQVIAKNFLNRIAERIPELKNHIVYFDAATPATLYRYTLNDSGAAFGWAKTPSQTFESIYNRTTPIPGLYLTGHWTSIAFELPGTCYTGYDTAQRILRKEKKS